jgi:hypothetical protein
VDGEPVVGEPDLREPRALDLAGLLEMLPFLDSGDLLAIDAAYREADSGPLADARAAAATAADEQGLTEELDRLQGSIVQWAGSSIFQNAAYPFAGMSDRMLREARMAAVPALVDAATALLLEDALGDDDRALLLDPVAAAVG